MNEKEIKSGKMNEFITEQMSPAQILIYKQLIMDFGIDESVVAFAGMQRGFKDASTIIDFIFEPFELVSGRQIKQHPFVGYDPALPKDHGWKSCTSRQKLSKSNRDLEKQSKIGK